MNCKTESVPTAGTSGNGNHPGPSKKIHKPQQSSSKRTALPTQVKAKLLKTRMQQTKKRIVKEVKAKRAPQAEKVLPLKKDRTLEYDTLGGYWRQSGSRRRIQ